VSTAVTRFSSENREIVKLVCITRGPVDEGIATLVDVDGACANAYDASHGAVYLVRPDGHVAGRWRAPDAPLLQRALATACGSPAPIVEHSP
jgi:3-(3-hydroxy-phenyl)propionate hydroxylase